MPVKGHFPRARIGALAAAACATAAVAIPSLSGAESFGPKPAPVESRCAALVLSPHVVKIGQTFEAVAGPPSSACGGPPSSIKWAWPTGPAAATESPGVVETHPCAVNATHCEFTAVLYTNPGVWEGVCISGVSPQGAFTSCDNYVVPIGTYHLLGGTIFDLPSEAPLTVALSGPGGHRTTTTDGGVWLFAVKNGVYTVSFKVGHKTIRHRVTVHAKPGTTITLNLTA